tara:strand:- start:239 stop:1078 length:840 start_codon:yes stop_codon:yes gene_type:complete
MFTLGIPLKQKRRTLGYLSNEYFPGGMKKLGQQVPYEIISTDREGGFFVISFPDMDEYEFRNITFQLKQQGVTVIGADSQLTEKTMKLVNLVPLKENRLSGPFTGEQIQVMVSRDSEVMFFANGNYYQATSEFQDFEGDLSVVDRDGSEDYINFEDIEFVEATHGFGGVGMENEGSCGYAPEGEDPNKANQPAGPHLLRKKIKEIIRETYQDDPNVQGTTGMEDAGGKVRDNILAAVPDNYSYKDLAQDIAYIIQNEYGSHNVKPFIQMLTQKLQTPNY